MISVRTVLCPVDFSSATTRQVDLAVDLCRAFGARLVLHHNVVELAIGAGVGWMWAPDHQTFERTIEAKLIEILERVPAETMPEVRLSHGPVADAVLSIGRDIDADLVVLSTGGGLVEGKQSVTERVLERASLPVLAIHGASPEHQTPRFSSTTSERQTLLVPTDFGPASHAAVDVAFELARRFAFDVNVLYVLPEHGRSAGGRGREEASRQLAAVVPSDLAERSLCRIETGTPAQVIARVADEIAASCIVMGEHARTPLRHWFRPDTSQSVLHRAPCPIWYVPGLKELSRPLAKASTVRPSMRDEFQDTTFHYWPANHLYGVVDSPDRAESVLAELLDAGVPRDRVRTWYGPAGEKAIDPTGKDHGRTARIWRALEKATGERDLLDGYATAVREGHVCIGVRCGSGDGKDTVTAILRGHGAHLISYLSLGSVERLSP